MSCQRPSPIITFEQDVPEITFDVTSGGESFRLYNYDPQLHIVSSDGTHITEFGLIAVSDGILAFDPSSADGVSEFYAQIAKLKLDVDYSAQIYLEATPLIEDWLGLYDIIDPYWMDYVPDPNDVPGWHSGEPRLSQTVLTVFPWDVREAFKLRGE